MPEQLREVGIELKKGFARLNDLFTRLADLLKEGMDGEVNIGIASHQAEEWYPLFGSWSPVPGQLGTVDSLYRRRPARQPAHGSLADVGRKRGDVRH